jgi:hypothetical protein
MAIYKLPAPATSAGIIRFISEAPATCCVEILLFLETRHPFQQTLGKGNLKFPPLLFYFQNINQY